MMEKKNVLPDRNDEELMVSIAQGDREAFQVLAQRYMNLLYSVAFRLFPQKHDAEDIVQDSLFRIWRKAHLWKAGSGATVSTWIYRLAYNLCLDQKRRSKRGMGRLQDTLIDNALMDDRPDADKQLQNKQTGAFIARALQALPERQSAALVLCHYQGMSNAEAAAIMGTSVKAVEALLVRARKALQQDLQKHRHKGVL